MSDLSLPPFLRERLKKELDKQPLEFLRRSRVLNFSLVTTSTTPGQGIGSYTPETGKKFCITLIIIEVYLTTLDTTAKLLGKLTICYPELNEYLVKDLQASNTSSGALFGVIIHPTEMFERELKQLKAICTPALTTSTKWIVTIWGYDK